MKNRFFFLCLLLSVCAFAIADEMPEHFYDHIQGLKDGELKDTLKAISILNRDTIDYGSDTWEVFYYSDRDENGYCMDMYCDTWQKFTSPGVAVAGCNIEHSFAKSWWGGAKNAAYKDCYHLNPSNETANSSRSNYPLGVPEKDFKANTGSLKVGRRHHDGLNEDHYVFEPKDEYKGDFARAYFYMVTRYGHWSDMTYGDELKEYKGWRLDNSDVGSKFAMQNDNYLVFQPWEQEILLAWHRQDPVSVKEINRADAVNRFQKNRNPYIDYPYLVEYIWGENAGTEVEMSHLMASSDPDFIPGESNGWREGGSVTPVVKYGVNWSVNGSIILTDSVRENRRVTSLPDKPAAFSEESTEFMGWTVVSIAGATDDEPAILYKDAKEIPAITEDITLYAVFAHKETIGNSNPATYTLDYEHQAGWENNCSWENNKYWLVDQGKSIVSPLIELSGLSSITVNMRTYGGKTCTNLDISTADGKLTTLVASNGTTPADCTWTKTDEHLSGSSTLTFTTNYGEAKKGVGVVSITINATGATTTYSRYITSYSPSTNEEVNASTQTMPSRKIMHNGRLYILAGDQLYTPSGQRVQ